MFRVLPQSEETLLLSVQLCFQLLLLLSLLSSLLLDAALYGSCHREVGPGPVHLLLHAESPLVVCLHSRRLVDGPRKWTATEDGDALLLNVPTLRY